MSVNNNTNVNVVHVHFGGTPTREPIYIDWFGLFMTVFCVAFGTLIFAGVSYCLGNFREEIVLVRDWIWGALVWFADNWRWATIVIIVLTVAAANWRKL